MNASQEIAHALIIRMRDAGLAPLPGAPAAPLLPDGLDRFMLGGNDAPHRCDDLSDRHVNLPPILVCPVDVFCLASDKIVARGKPFRPYWILTTLLHDWSGHYPAEPNRSATMIEAACALAQQMRYGSMQYQFNRGTWGHERKQIYKCPHRKLFVRDIPPSGYNHHVLLVRHCIGLEMPTIDV